MNLRPLFISVVALLFAACTVDSVEPEIPNTGDKNDSTKVEPNADELTFDEMFDIESVAHVELNFPQESWNTLLKNFDIQPHNEVCVVATFRYEKNGKSFQIDSVGVRLRGNTSRRRPEGNTGDLHSSQNPDWHHAHFHVKFDEFIDDQRFVGQDRLLLKWHKDDAMYCREIYCYDLFRRFGVWTAPRASYATVGVKIGNEPTADFGVYAQIEGVCKRSVKRRLGGDHWQSDEGNLWKGSWGATLSPNSMNDGNMGVSVAELDQVIDYVYDLKTNKKKGLDAAKTQLKAFVNDMNVLPSGSVELKNFLEERVEIDQFLRAYAVNVMVGMWDDYWHGNGNNFYFYFDQNGKFYFIPFDYDNTLGTSGGDINAGTQDLLKWGSLDGDRVLMRKVMSIDEYRNRYKQYIKELADPKNDLFDTDKSIARIRGWHKMIQNRVPNATGEDMEIRDVPASWGNCPFYRIFSGNDQGGQNGEANWFKTKIKSINF